jgi:hypothetical protein
VDEKRKAKDGSDDYIARERLVLMQIAYDVREDVQANTPPIKAIRCVVSVTATKSRTRQIAIYDVSVAFFHAKFLEGEELFARAPAGINPPGKIMRIKGAMYGSRRAGQLWQERIYEDFEAAGFEAVVVAANLLHHPGDDIDVAAYGDDFVVSGEPEQLDKMDVFLENHYEIKKLGRIGPGGERVGHVLKREIGWSTEGFTWSGDTSHTGKILKTLAMEDCKEAPTPGTKATGHQRDALDALGRDEASVFRSGAGSALYVSIDRYDIQYACKVIMKDMATPTIGGMAKLKRLARYLKGRPKVLWIYDYQPAPEYIDVYCDSDWQGEEETRRSTSSVIELYGSHPEDSCSVTQDTVSLSSGEAELKALNRGAAGIIQTSEILKGLGMEVKRRAFSDSSAGRGMTQRRGSGKVRHLEGRELWLQEKVRRGELEVVSVGTEDNPADLGTKYLSEDRILKLLALSGMRPAKG